MNQYDLYANTDPDTQKAYPYFVDVQSDLLDLLKNRVVIPLSARGDNRQGLAATIVSNGDHSRQKLSFTDVPNHYSPQLLSEKQSRFPVSA